MKRQCQFQSNNIDDMQFQIQNQLKIFSSMTELQDTQAKMKNDFESFMKKNKEQMKEMSEKMVKGPGGGPRSGRWGATAR